MAMAALVFGLWPMALDVDLSWPQMQHIFHLIGKLADWQTALSNVQYT